MEVEVTGEVEIECPKCKHIFYKEVSLCQDIDMSDYAPDYSWRD